MRHIACVCALYPVLTWKSFNEYEIMMSLTMYSFIACFVYKNKISQQKTGTNLNMYMCIHIQLYKSHPVDAFTTTTKHRRKKVNSKTPFSFSLCGNTQKKKKIE